MTMQTDTSHLDPTPY